MTRLRKVIWITLLSIVVIAAGTVVTLKLTPVADACERVNSVLAESGQGRSAVYSLEVCTNIGTIINASVDVVSPSGRRQTAFRFLPVYGLVKWRAGRSDWSGRTLGRLDFAALVAYIDWNRSNGA